MNKKLINELDVLLGRRIREFRIDDGVSIAGLAAELNVSAQQFQKYEKAVNRISATKLLIVSQYLKKPINEFFEGSLAEVISDELSTVRMRLSKSAKILKPDHLKLVANLAEGLSKEA